MDDRRQLQDSPVLGDVWIAYAAKPAVTLDLLITPYRNVRLVRWQFIAKCIEDLKLPRQQAKGARRLFARACSRTSFLPRVFRAVRADDARWKDRKVQAGLQAYTRKTAHKNPITTEWARANDEDTRLELARGVADFTSLDRYFVLAGIILCRGAKQKFHGTRCWYRWADGRKLRS
jgi:hypothetical protein